MTSASAEHDVAQQTPDLAASSEETVVDGVRIHRESRPDVTELLTPQEWCERYRVTVLDPDGWRDPHDPKPWDEPISLVEFASRSSKCTVDALNPEWDRVSRDAATARKQPVDEPKPPPPVKIGTGMPATTLLEAFGQWLREAFGASAYHVGSSIHGKQWRDVDVRLMLPDDEFAALFPGYQFAHQRDAKWALLCAALSELGKRLTGLPIDFQIQSVTEANKLYPGPRNPLDLFTHASAQAEIERRAAAAADPDPDGSSASGEA